MLGRWLYTVEWLIVQSFTLPTEEKLAVVQKTLDENQWKNNPYFLDIATVYMREKETSRRLCSGLHRL